MKSTLAKNIIFVLFFTITNYATAQFNILVHNDNDTIVIPTSKVDSVSFDMTPEMQAQMKMYKTVKVLTCEKDDAQTKCDSTLVDSLQNEVSAMKERLNQVLQNYENMQKKLTELDSQSGGKPNVIYYPKELYCLVGTKVNVFINGLAFLPKTYQYFMNAECERGVVAKGSSIDDIYYYDVTSKVDDFDISFNFCDGTKKIYASNKTKMISVNKGTSPSSMKNVLFIGDSYTEQDIWVCELRRMITGELAVNTRIQGRKMYDDSEYAPSADSIENLNFVGDRTVNDGTPTLGTSGKHYVYYNSSDSPLWNPSTNKIDFDYYIANNTIKGTKKDLVAGDKLDYVVILLGQNGQSTTTAMDAMWDALIAHNPNIKVIVCGVPFTSVCYNGISYMSPYSLNNAKPSMNKNYAERCATDKYKNNFLYVDTSSRYDNHKAFDSIDVRINREDRFAHQPSNWNNSLDAIHPSYVGYFQLADAVRGAFHYWFLNSNN